MTGLRTYENLGQKINAETAAFVKILLAEGYTHKQILERIGPENITIVIIYIFIIYFITVYILSWIRIR